MIISVANPIYDSVFKFLMEDERIARTILSALLKEEVLSVFDQSNRDKSNRQVMVIDETKYEGDDDMMYLLRRLTAATANAELRMDMNVEDEYFSAIEHRDTELMAKTQRLEEMGRKQAEKDNQLTVKDN